MIKVNRPDGQQEELGLNVIDEPITNGIDPYIFKLMLIDETKHKVDRYEVRSIPNSEKNPNAIQTWIDKVAEMRKNKVSTSVIYSKNFPDIEKLMQVWPEKVESSLKEILFPDERLNLSVDNYSKLVCNMIDIPVHIGSNKSLIESLHVLFTLYSEFKQNQHFQRNTVNEKEGNVQSKMFY
jgi:intraflagellar transport protein 46